MTMLLKRMSSLRNGKAAGIPRGDLMNISEFGNITFQDIRKGLL
jgi:hypothetical protein